MLNIDSISKGIVIDHIKAGVGFSIFQHLDLKILGFIDPNITVNIIEDEKIIEKINLSLPEKVEGLINCKNPRCITSIERDIVHRFVLLDKEEGSYRCDYCDHIYTWEGLKNDNR